MHNGGTYSYSTQIVTPMKVLPLDDHSVLPVTWMLLLVLTGIITLSPALPMYGAISAGVVKVKALVITIGDLL